MNHVVLVGRLTKDPEMKYIPGTGTPVANFTIAIDRNYTKKDGTKETDFIPVEVMGKTAEFVANYITKGRLVAVQGSIRVNRYQDKEGNNKIFTKVSARGVQPLDNKNNSNQNTPKFDSSGLNSEEWKAIDDDEIPF